MGLIKSIQEYIELAKIQRRLSLVIPSFADQKKMIDQFRKIEKNVKSAHNPSHLLQFVLAMLELPSTVEGCIVEAGAFKGAGTCKISVAAQRINRHVYVFDSFKGLPDNNELHEKSTLGHSIKDWFKEGNFNGSEEEVRNNILKFGEPGMINFISGWFEETMPSFKQPIALAYLDVDLASSTRACLKYLFPLLSPGGAIYSQDGDFPLVINVFRDEKFWFEEVGCNKMPLIKGLGKKITIIEK